MLVYSYKGEKSLNTELYCYDSLNFTKIWNYLGKPKRFCLNNEEGSLMSRHIYRSYNTLGRFNNLLTTTYKVNNDLEDKLFFIKEYLQNNQDIKESFDNECRKIYEKLEKWHNRLLNNSNSLNDIKWEVARLMKHYEKKEIYRVASVNLKRNYYDFCV